MRHRIDISVSSQHPFREVMADWFRVIDHRYFLLNVEQSAYHWCAVTANGDGSALVGTAEKTAAVRSFKFHSF